MPDKATIGHAFWELLHALPGTMEEVPSGTDILAANSYLLGMQLRYPCEDCRPGFEYVNENPPDYSSREAFDRWACTFHNAVRTHLGQPIVVNCDHGLETSKCSTCSRKLTMADLSRYSSEGMKMRDSVKSILDMESKKYGIPVPKVYFQQNKEHCGDTSCTITSQKNPIAFTKIYYNPAQYSPRTVLHEWYHYMATVMGPEKVTQLLGAEYRGDPDSEEEADKFAMAEVEKMFPAGQVVAMDSRGVEGINMVPASNGSSMQQQLMAPEDLKVMRDSSNVISRLDVLYNWAAPISKVDAHSLNLAYTPEILGTGIETAFSFIFAPEAEIFWNAIAGFVLWGIATADAIGAEDKKLLNEVAAHEISRLITLGNPANLSAATMRARSVAQMLGRGQVMPALTAGLKNPQDIAINFRGALQAMQNLVSGRAGAPSGRPADVPEQRQSTVGGNGVSGFQ